MKVYALVDFMGTFNMDQKDEYALIQRWLKRIVKKDFTYKTDMFPNQLENDRVDIYVIDYGGVGPGCKDTVASLYRSLVNQIENKPNTLFILWSQFTQDWYKEIIEIDAKELSEFNVVFGQDDETISKWFES